MAQKICALPSDDMQTVIALVDEIMGAITACRTGSQISDCAKHYAGALKVLGASNEHKVRVIHIKNYAALRRKQIMDGTAHKPVVYSGKVCDVCGQHPAPFGFTKNGKTTWACGPEHEKGR